MQGLYHSCQFKSSNGTCREIGGKYALPLQTIGAGDLLKRNIWNGNPVTPGTEPGFIKKLN